MPNIKFTENGATGQMAYEISFKERTDSVFTFGFGTTGLGLTGFEGVNAQRQINFTGISGKLYDQEGNWFYSYTSGEYINLQGNCFSGRHNYTVNSQLINSNCTRRTGSIDNFYYTNMNTGFGLSIAV